MTILNRLFVVFMAMMMAFTGVFCMSDPVVAKSKKGTSSSTEKWGVFIGGKCLKKNSKKVKKYRYVVVDAQYYNKSEIRRFKKGGRKVYSYLSIGTLERYRPYYNKFRKYIKGRYNNWDDEQWVDVTKKDWQDFVVKNLVRDFRKKGINGLWIDNTDVYYEYPTKEIFQSLVSMLRKIRQKGFPVIINGGDVFVSELIRTGNQKLIKGIMQEEVLTRIANYRKGRFAHQEMDDYLYFTRYCTSVKKAGLSVALLEYARSKKMKKTITNFCKKNGYTVYISNNVQLQ